MPPSHYRHGLDRTAPPYGRRGLGLRAIPGGLATALDTMSTTSRIRVNGPTTWMAAPPVTIGVEVTPERTVRHLEKTMERFGLAERWAYRFPRDDTLVWPEPVTSVRRSFVQRISSSMFLERARTPRTVPGRGHDGLHRLGPGLHPSEVSTERRDDSQPYRILMTFISVSESVSQTTSR